MTVPPTQCIARQCGRTQGQAEAAAQARNWRKRRPAARADSDSVNARMVWAALHCNGESPLLV